MFNYHWDFKDYPKEKTHKVFGTFICGGGSSMGYKLAGLNHLGGVEIDPKIAEIYKANHLPKYLYNEDIRTFINREDLPSELFDLDILDGSPPCSSFSMSGSREKAWNQSKKFREGQAEQKLDDLFFHYIDLIKKLQPKVFIAENVTGMLMGNARAYVKEILEKMNKANYNVQLFLLNGATMGIPQRRERLFFIGLRKDISKPKLNLEFSLKPITFRQIKNNNGKEVRGVPDGQHMAWKGRKFGDKGLDSYYLRTIGKSRNFSRRYLYEDDVPATIIASNLPLLYSEPRCVNLDELLSIGSFPRSYNFQDINPNYLIGMSVPPVMTAQIAYQIKKQWLEYEGP